MKKCIFHYPGKISNNPTVGSELRPKMMLEAFKNIGYDVFEITGDRNERRNKIKILRQKIRDGVEYEFVYSESVNTPLMLSDKDHIPRYPFLDYYLFKICKSNNIPTALFYRDSHWKFPEYKDNVNLAKRLILIPLFKLDLLIYKLYIDVIYFPDLIIKKYIMEKYNVLELPPGGKIHSNLFEDKAKHAGECKNFLNIFYVGGVYGIYDIRGFCKAVRDTENVYLTISTPKEQWEKYKEEYSDCLCDRITIVHKTSNELEPYYIKADLTAFCLAPHEYADIAIPIKVFESISYGTPIITSKSMVVSKIIEKEEIGWVIDYSDEELRKTLRWLRDNRKDIHNKTVNTIKVAHLHTWDARASKVAGDLLYRK